MSSAVMAPLPGSGQRMFVSGILAACYSFFVPRESCVLIVGYPVVSFHHNFIEQVAVTGITGDQLVIDIHPRLYIDALVITF